MKHGEWGALTAGIGVASGALGRWGPSLWSYLTGIRQSRSQEAESVFHRIEAYADRIERRLKQLERDIFECERDRAELWRVLREHGLAPPSSLPLTTIASP